MTGFFHVYPVGWPPLLAFALGGVAFFATLGLARWRADRAPRVADRGKAGISWLWIAVQGLAIAIVIMPGVALRGGPATTAMFVQAALVLVLMLGAIALFHAASSTMGKNWSLVARTRQDHELVQTGPFAFVRHPIYVALFLFMCAMAIAYGHAANLIVSTPVYLLGTWMRIRHEERLLRDMFGSAYDAYAARVKRFVPGVF